MTLTLTPLAILQAFPNLNHTNTNAVALECNDEDEEPGTKIAPTRRQNTLRMYAALGRSFPLTLAQLEQALYAPSFFC